MTTRPRKLPTAIMAALAGIASLPAAALEKMQEEMTTAKAVPNYGYHSAGGGNKRSKHRVAHDKRAARKAKNRKAARRRYHG